MPQPMTREQFHFGPELCCCRCGNKEWRLHDEGVVCTICRDGIFVKTVTDEREKTEQLREALAQAEQQLKAQEIGYKERIDKFNSYYVHQDLLLEAQDKLQASQQEVTRLRSLLKELHAVVQGECPSLLNEDSGGSARLAMDIEAALAPEALPKESHDPSSNTSR